MAYSIDYATGDLIINGFQNGIGADPQSGLVDLKSVSLSIPNEASANFQTYRTSSLPAGWTFAPSPLAVPVIVTGLASSALTYAATAGLDNGMCIYFTSIGNLTGGIAINTPYWIYNLVGTPASSTQFQLYTTYSEYTSHSNALTITGAATGSPAFVAYYMAESTHQVYAQTENAYWMVDILGQVWSNLCTTQTGLWTFTGNLVPNSSYTNGNGLVYYKSSPGAGVAPVGYIMVIHNSSIDVTKSALGSWTWNYQWDVYTGGYGSYSATPTPIFMAPPGFTGSHASLTTNDNHVHICDTNGTQGFYERVNEIFDPTTLATYASSFGDPFAVNGVPYFEVDIPNFDTANCLTQLGGNLLIGGSYNAIYPWDRSPSDAIGIPIYLSENNVIRMITTNQGTYVFCGNKGNIYITNGSQANLFAKVPDHISGTIEPYFYWTDACFIKNQLYFSFYATTNNGVALTNMGGIWAIDLTTNAIRLSNQLSFGNYTGYATVLIPIYPNSSGADTASQINSSAGISLFAGWQNNTNSTSSWGLDAPFNPATNASVPYTNTAAMVVSDLIPVGTLFKKMTPSQFEVKTSMPLTANETIALYAGYSLADYTTGNMTLVGSITGSAATYGTTAVVSANFPTTVQNQQWLIVQAILTSTATSPSYCRLTQIRVIGETIKSQVATQPYSVQ